MEHCDSPMSTEESSAKVRGGILLAKALAEKQIEMVYTLSGGFINTVLEGLMEYEIPVLNLPHEQMAGNMADAWSRLNRKAVVCLCGPEGFANVVPAMAEAYFQRSPVIFITSASTLKRDGRGGFKEIDHNRVAEPITKSTISVTAGERIAEAVDKAYDLAVNGNPGPVHISIPVDLLYSSYEPEDQEGERAFKLSRREIHRPSPNPEDMRRLEGIMRNAKKPVIVAGNGVWWSGAESHLETTAAQLGIPVYNAPYHYKMLDIGSEVSLGIVDIHLNPPSETALAEADVILVIGCPLDNLPGAVLTALGEMATAEQLNIESEWIEANRQRRKEWADGMHKMLDEEGDGPLHPLKISREILQSLNEDDYLVIDGGDTHFWAEIAVNIAAAEGKRLRGVLQTSPLSILGVGVPFSVTAKMNSPESRVVLLSGDGAFLAGGLSIEAAFANDIPIVVVVDNNRGLGSIKQQQMRLFKNGQSFKTDFRDIPFDKLVAGLGGYGETVERIEELSPAMERAFASGLPSCINVKSKSVISPLIVGLTDRRVRSSIE
jgi:acetolactate synthase-1/2/3 large subunit